MPSMCEEDIAPPLGPPPPQVPEGWVARWDPRYETFFYVNLTTRQSQWEKPPMSDGNSAPMGVRPSSRSESRSSNPYVKLEDNPPPYGSPSSSAFVSGTSSQPAPEAQSSQMSIRAQSQSPRSQQSNQQQSSSSSTDSREKKSGLGTRISRLLSSHSSPRRTPSCPHASYPRYTAPFDPAQQPYLQLQEPYWLQSDYRTGGSSGVYGTGYGGRPRRSGGLGVPGATALGMGGGILGGLMLADAFDHDHEAYADGFVDGVNYDEDLGWNNFGWNDLGGNDFRRDF